MFEHTLTTLQSGLTVIQVPLPFVKSVTVLVLCNTGSRYEQPQEQGIAHFFEHMVFKGTQKFPQPMDLASAVDAVGADFNAFTSKEYTGYYVKAAADHLHLALDVVSDMLLTPQLRQEDIDREKGVIIEEMNMYIDTPARHIANVFEQMFFRSEGLAHDIIGTKETVSSLTRADFERFLKAWYGLSNMIVIVAGAAEVVKTKATLDTIEKMFSKEFEPRVTGKVDLHLHIDKEPYSVKKLEIVDRKTEQAHLVLGWPGIKRSDPDRYALSVFSTLMGGNMSSRLFSEVREKRGLCYYVHSDTDFYHEEGVIGASAGVDPSRVEEAIKVILEEFYALKNQTKEVSTSELDRAKEFLVGKTTLGLEDSEYVAQYVGMRQLLQGKIETPDEIFAKIRAVTVADVYRVAQRLLHEGEARMALIGPFTEQAVFEKLLQ